MFKRSANGEGMVYDPNDNTIPMKRHYGHKKHGFMRDCFSKWYP